MDTRSKIVDAAFRPKGPLVVVTGFFDPLLVEHARSLREVRQRTAGAALMAIVIPSANPLLPGRARAEMLAALRMVDYVLIANDADLDGLIRSLAPLETVRLEGADELRTRRLIEHVHRRQLR